MEEGRKLRLLTEHYYLSGARTRLATIEHLLKTDARFSQMSKTLQTDTATSGIPYRLVELNSFSGGGQPRVSDTFASALWGLDLMFTLASAAGAGINFETGMNQLGVVSFYSPIFDDLQGAYTARPLYYALLAFRGVCGGRIVGVTYDAQGINLSAYGFRDSAGELWVALINKDLSADADVRIQAPPGVSSGELWRLTAPAANSREGVTFAGAEVSSSALWSAGPRDTINSAGGQLAVPVSAANAILVRLS